MFTNYLENVRKTTPLIHCITNYVTVNDVANTILAAGGSPIMADEPQEAAEITSICRGLCINIGTLHEQSIRAMFVAGKQANALGHPILLDPVGAGASRLRTETALDLIRDVKPQIIKGNASEIKTLALGQGTTQGVDADLADVVTDENIDSMVEFVKKFAKKIDAVVAVTGKIDLVADANRCYVIRNGHPQMCQITGTGCMLSGMAAAYVTANSEDLTTAVAAAVCVMGLAGEIGASAMGGGDGNAALRNRIIDAICGMDTQILRSGARYEIR